MTAKSIDSILNYAKQELEKLEREESIIDVNGEINDEDISAEVLVNEILSKDAAVSLKISPDVMTATLIIYPAVKNGTHIELDQVNQLLLEHNVIWGIDFGKIETILAKAKTTSEKITEIIAQGQPAIPGKDASFIEVYKKNRSIPKKKDQVDYREFNTIYTVEQHCVILSKVSATDGVAGVNIKGKKIPAVKGKDITFTAGKNVKWEPSTNEFIAECDGKVDIEDQVISVTPLFHVAQDIDMSIGNIDFNGDVVIEGSVLDDFIVRSSKKIEIFGKVYAAQIEADGDIEIHKGFIGRHKGVVRSKQSVSVAFVENGKIEADGDVIVKKAIMHSDVSAGGKIYMKKENSSLIGGTVYAAKGLTAYNVGNSMEVRTTVVIGKNRIVEQEIERLHKKIKFFSDSVRRLKEILVQILGKNIKIQELNRQQQEIVKQVSSKVKKYSAEIRERKKAVDEFEKDLFTKDPVYLKVRGDLFPGVVLTVGKTTQDIKEIYRYSSLSENREENKFNISSFE